MIIGEGAESVRQHLDLLECAIAELPRHELADVPERMLGEVRKLSATLGQLLVDAIAQGLIRAPAGRDIDHPWLAIARGRLQGKIVSASCRGFEVRRVPPCSCPDALQALAEMQRDYERRLGIEAARYIDAGSEILYRHVLYEALSWLPSIETAVSFPKNIELEDADGTRIGMIADWIWQEGAFLLRMRDAPGGVVGAVEEVSSPPKLLTLVEERKVMLAESVRAIRGSLLSEAETPTAEAKTSPREKTQPTPKSTQALKGRDATEVVLRYQPEEGFSITISAKGSAPRKLKEPPPQVRGVLRKALEAAISATRELPEAERYRAFRQGFEPGSLNIKPGGSRAFFLDWWADSISGGEALLASGKKDVYLVNWKMALPSPE